VRMLCPWTAAVGVGRIDWVSSFLQPTGLPHFVPLREFVVSPGFAGAAVVAAILALCVVLYGSRHATKRFQQELEQRERHNERAREDQQHAAAVTRCWERLVWVVEKAGIEPATGEGASLGLGPVLASELVRGLLRDAEQLDDITLVKAVAVYQDQFGLVLAQQGGPLSGLAADASPLATGKPDEKPASSANEKPNNAAAPAAVETPPATVRVADGEWRRRRR
jgi:hypothetical protein